jgi:hypothetical protein
MFSFLTVTPSLANWKAHSTLSKIFAGIVKAFPVTIIAAGKCTQTRFGNPAETEDRLFTNALWD